MVTYIRSDLDFILDQIKIAEAHAAGQPLFGPGGLVPAYNISWGLRTVDGTYNHLLPGQEQWGAADQRVPRAADAGVPHDRDDRFRRPGGRAPLCRYSMPYTPGVDNDGPGTFADSGRCHRLRTVRTISNLIVDQTLGNPAAILTGLQRAGIDGDQLAIVGADQAAYEPLQPLFNAVADAADAAAEARAAAEAADAAAGSPPLHGCRRCRPPCSGGDAQARAALDCRRMPPGRSSMRCSPPTASSWTAPTSSSPTSRRTKVCRRPFNSWFTLFGQFFDHGLDLVEQGRQRHRVHPAAAG